MEVSVCFYAQRLLLAGGGFCDARKCSNPKEKEGKKMKQRKLILILAIVLSVAIAAGGTMAYLQDTDEDVNVMTLGNVYINQLEYERVPTEGHELTNDAWVSTGETDKYGYTPDEVRPFTQAKPLYPAVFADGKIKWDERAEGKHQQSWADVKGEKKIGAPGSFQLFDDSVKNVVDKFVFVENTGNSDAYVRTWFAFEQGDVAAEDFDKVIATNENDAEGESGSGHWVWEKVASDVKIDGNTYVVKVATYLGPKSAPTQVLPAGEISYVSLAQVYMMPEATNDDVIAIDGNKNGTYDILVLSQAVQTQGFASTEAALNEAFGEPTVDNIPWENVEWPNFIYDYDDLYNAAYTGGKYYLASDIELPEYTLVYYGLDLDLNGHTMTLTKPAGSGYMYPLVALSGNVNITGEGNIISESGFYIDTGNTVFTINGGNYQMTPTNSKYHIYLQNSAKLVINDGVFTTTDESAALMYCINGFIEINGGFFQNLTNKNAALLSMGNNLSYVNNQKITISGGTFVNWNPMDSAFARPWTNPDVPALIVLADGCEVVSETQDNGDVWYTVVKK